MINGKLYNALTRYKKQKEKTQTSTHTKNKEELGCITFNSRMQHTSVFKSININKIKYTEH